ncbi:hypothetical protein BN2475_160023 [Paraburkholderia ribeironis]|uniref:Uncharacterized protein n=1 Tax=Paraburkholderia ribeironis TaxID=1247936 RepID=A0A1N7RV90_9BURK|nr:hypothetical protein BN2475_160023 [Paraburkholderia ribeironis]
MATAGVSDPLLPPPHPDNIATIAHATMLLFTWPLHRKVNSHIHSAILLISLNSLCIASILFVYFDKHIPLLVR